MTYEEINQKLHADPSLLCDGWRRGASGKWINSRHVTRKGSPAAKGKQGSYILPSRDCVFDGASGEAESFIAFYARQNGLPFHRGGWTTDAERKDNRRAWAELARACGGSLDDGAEAEEKWQAKQKKLNRLQDIYAESIKNRKQPEGEEKGRVREVLDYFTNDRGWTMAEIEAAGIGVLPQLKARMEGLDERFCAVIPIYADGRLVDLKLRNLAATTADKYRNISGAQLSSFAYLTATFDSKATTAYICEGELDALRCHTRGLTCFASQGGGNLANNNKLKEVKQRGWLKLIFIADNDADGQGLRYAINGALAAEQMGLEASLVTIDGAKDADEYITAHPNAALVCLLNDRPAATIAAEHLLNNLGGSYADFYEDAEALYCAVRPHLRKGLEDALTAADDKLQSHFNAYAADVIEELRDAAKHADKQADKEEAEKRRKEASDLYSKAAELAGKGKADEAKKLADKAQEVASAAKIDLTKYSVDLITALNEIDTEGIPTDVTFDDGVQWTLPRKGLSINAARTGHGKTRMMENLTVNTLRWLIRENKDEAIVYFVIEEAVGSILSHLVSIAANSKLIDGNNFAAVAQYARLRDESARKEEMEKLSRALASKPNFSALEEARTLIAEALQTHRLYVIAERNIEKMIAVCKAIEAEERPIAAAFIDYAQKVTTLEAAKDLRLRIDSVTNRLTDYKLATNIAFVMGAQLNREVKSPLEMDEGNLAEASFLEQATDDLTLSFNSAKTYADDKYGSTASELKTRLEQLGYTHGLPGMIVLLHPKARLSDIGGAAVLDFNGATGKIQQSKQSESIINNRRKQIAENAAKAEEAKTRGFVDETEELIF